MPILSSIEGPRYGLLTLFQNDEYFQHLLLRMADQRLDDGGQVERSLEEKMRDVLDDAEEIRKDSSYVWLVITLTNLLKEDLQCVRENGVWQAPLDPQVISDHITEQVGLIQESKNDMLRYHIDLPQQLGEGWYKKRVKTLDREISLLKNMQRELHKYITDVTLAFSS